MNDQASIGVDLSSREPVLYFAYGGNMDPTQIGGRCRVAPEKVAVARLADHALVFHGQDERWDGGEETVVRRPGAEVWGVVWLVPAAAFDRLDAWQGVRLDGTGRYFHSPADVVGADGGIHSVILYRRSSLDTAIPPSAPHLARIVEAARRQGLPSAAITELAVMASIEASGPVPREARTDRFLAQIPLGGGSCAC